MPMMNLPRELLQDLDPALQGPVRHGVGHPEVGRLPGARAPGHDQQAALDRPADELRVTQAPGALWEDVERPLRALQLVPALELIIDEIALAAVVRPVLADLDVEG